MVQNKAQSRQEAATERAGADGAEHKRMRNGQNIADRLTRRFPGADEARPRRHEAGRPNLSSRLATMLAAISLAAAGTPDAVAGQTDARIRLAAESSGASRKGGVMNVPYFTTVPTDWPPSSNDTKEDKFSGLALLKQAASAGLIETLPNNEYRFQNIRINPKNYIQNIRNGLFVSEHIQGTILFPDVKNRGKSSVIIFIFESINERANVIDIFATKPPLELLEDSCSFKKQNATQREGNIVAIAKEWNGDPKHTQIHPVDALFIDKADGTITKLDPKSIECEITLG